MTTTTKNSSNAASSAAEVTNVGRVQHTESCAITVRKKNISQNAATARITTASNKDNLDHTSFQNHPNVSTQWDKMHLPWKPTPTLTLTLPKNSFSGKLNFLMKTTLTQYTISHRLLSNRTSSHKIGKSTCQPTIPW